MRKFIDIVEASQPVRLFHFTPAKFIASIKDNGLDPSFRVTNSTIPEGDKNIYLAGDAYQACGYIYYHDVADGFLLTVEVSSLESGRLHPDDVDLADMVGDEWDEYSWSESIATCGQCAYNGVIPVSALTVEAYVSHDGRREAINQPLASLSANWIK